MFYYIFSEGKLNIREEKNQYFVKKVINKYCFEFYNRNKKPKKHLKNINFMMKFYFEIKFLVFLNKH